MKHFLKKQYLLLMTLVTIVVAVNSCVTLRKSDKKTLKIFKKLNQTPIIYHDTYNDLSVRYIAAKELDVNLPTIIFVHGAPGSSDNFYKHLQDLDLQEKANLVTIDRLGYGYSNFGKAETSIKKQIDFVDFVAKKYNHNKIILVGWSYGATIVGAMGINNQDYAHIIMIAPAVSPKDEKYFSTGNLAKWKATKWFVPKIFVVAEDEKLAHANELELLENQWQKITTPITYYHGDKDRLVPYKNMPFLKTKIKDSILKCVTIKDGSHFIIFKNYNSIKTEILDVLNGL